MFRIVSKQIIALNIKRIDIAAAQIASKILPGQFVMITVTRALKPIPMSVIEADDRKGVISFIVHEVGTVTETLGALSIGDEVASIVGPLGAPASIDQYGIVICVTTGIGTAQILPICKALKKKGNRVLGVIGAKSKKVLMLESQMRVVCDELFIATNDGSYERKGLASQILNDLLEKYKVNAIYAIGSVDMMQQATNMARTKNIPVWVTVNPYMVNGLGMCGSCRVKIGDQFQMACVDGPQFDGRLIDFDDLNKRDQALKENTWEKQNLPSNLKSDGFPTLVKSFLGMGKKKM